MKDLKEAKAYYAKLEKYTKQAQLRTTIGYKLTKRDAGKLLKQYLKFRGYLFRGNVSLETLSMLLLELDTKDEKTSCGISLMLWGTKEDSP
jgi:hypothetical protein